MGCNLYSCTSGVVLVLSLIARGCLSQDIREETASGHPILDSSSLPDSGPIRLQIFGGQRDAKNAIVAEIETPQALLYIPELRQALNSRQVQSIGSEIAQSHHILPEQWSRRLPFHSTLAKRGDNRPPGNPCLSCGDEFGSNVNCATCRRRTAAKKHYEKRKAQIAAGVIFKSKCKKGHPDYVQRGSGNGCPICTRKKNIMRTDEGRRLRGLSPIPREASPEVETSVPPSTEAAQKSTGTERMHEGRGTPSRVANVPVAGSQIPQHVLTEFTSRVRELHQARQNLHSYAQSLPSNAWTPSMKRMIIEAAQRRRVLDQRPQMLPGSVANQHSTKDISAQKILPFKSDARQTQATASKRRNRMQQPTNTAGPFAKRIRTNTFLDRVPGSFRTNQSGRVASPSPRPDSPKRPHALILPTRRPSVSSEHERVARPQEAPSENQGMAQRQRMDPTPRPLSWEALRRERARIESLGVPDPDLNTDLSLPVRRQRPASAQTTRVPPTDNTIRFPTRLSSLGQPLAAAQSTDLETSVARPVAAYIAPVRVPPPFNTPQRPTAFRPFRPEAAVQPGNTQPDQLQRKMAATTDAQGFVDSPQAHHEAQAAQASRPDILSLLDPTTSESSKGPASSTESQKAAKALLALRKKGS